MLKCSAQSLLSSSIYVIPMSFTLYTNRLFTLNSALIFNLLVEEEESFVEY